MHDYDHCRKTFISRKSITCRKTLNVSRNPWDSLKRAARRDGKVLRRRWRRLRRPAGDDVELRQCSLIGTGGIAERKLVITVCLVKRGGVRAYRPTGIVIAVQEEPSFEPNKPHGRTRARHRRP